MKQSDGSWPNTGGCAFMKLSLLLACLILSGCSQHQGMPMSEETVRMDQHLPFDGTSDKGGIFPTGSLIPTAIPAGTSFAIRLRTGLSSATSRPGDSFEAVMDEPVVVRGKIMVPAGASVTGRVLDARTAGSLQGPGYMRLALIAVSLNGQFLPIQTSSIFVKLGSHHGPNSATPAGAPAEGVSIDGVSASGSVGRDKGALIGTSTTGSTASQFGADSSAEIHDVGFSADRRLTFRLAQLLPLGS
jgi:hypothetical protein